MTTDLVSLKERLLLSPSISNELALLAVNAIEALERDVEYWPRR